MHQNTKQKRGSGGLILLALISVSHSPPCPGPCSPLRRFTTVTSIAVNRLPYQVLLRVIGARRDALLWPLSTPRLRACPCAYHERPETTTKKLTKSPRCTPGESGWRPCPSRTRTRTTCSFVPDIANAIDTDIDIAIIIGRACTRHGPNTSHRKTTKQNKTNTSDSVQPNLLYHTMKSSYFGELFYLSGY